jgi:hypothetical protein
MQNKSSYAKVHKIIKRLDKYRPGHRNVSDEIIALAHTTAEQGQRIRVVTTPDPPFSPEYWYLDGCEETIEPAAKRRPLACTTVSCGQPVC